MFTRKGILFSLSIALSVGLVCATLAPAAHADTTNERTQVTFSAPVQVPGRVLPAGTYTFQLMSNRSDIHVVRIFNRNRTKVYDTFVAIPTYRKHATGKPVIVLKKPFPNSPAVVQKWFYPGTHYGQEFTYKHALPTSEMAKATSKTKSGQG